MNMCCGTEDVTRHLSLEMVQINQFEELHMRY